MTKEIAVANTVVWADIPVTDMDLARAFYSKLLQADIPLMDEGQGRVALLPGENGAVSADLALGESQMPSTEDCTIYLDSRGDVEGMIARAREAGGKVLTPPTFMGDMMRTIALIMDSEGNRIGLHKFSEYHEIQAPLRAQREVEIGPRAAGGPSVLGAVQL